MSQFSISFEISGKFIKHTIEARDENEAKYMLCGKIQQGYFQMIPKNADLLTIRYWSVEEVPGNNDILDRLRNIMKC